MNNTTSEGINLFDGLSVYESSQDQNTISKQCSGKGCTKIAKNLLLISYINKKGYFCDVCTSDLLTMQLAVRVKVPQSD
jgi:hypothetical protein